MRLLLDTNVLIAFGRGEIELLGARMSGVVAHPDTSSFVSSASLWEIAIKTRLGKLDPGMPLEDLPAFFTRAGLALLAIDHRHAIAGVDPEPATRDPFDRLLLAQCSVEGLRLVTIDRALSIHPLAWQPA